MNNNDETIKLMDLECLVRVFMNDKTNNPYALNLLERQRLLDQINDKLLEIDQGRGFTFDVVASTEEWKSKNS